MQQKSVSRVCILLILGMMFFGVLGMATTHRQVYAVGEQIEVSFDTNGAGAMNSTQVIVGDDYILSEPTRSGYDFEGWYYNGNLVPTQGEWTITDTPITLQARWNVVTYNITYSGIEGINGTNPNPVNYNITQNITLEAVSKDGYIFGGWYKDAANAITTISAGEYVGDLVLEAQWNVITYNITYNNIFECNNSRNPTQYDVEDEITLLGLDRYGYEFLGWYTDLDDASTVVTEIEQGTMGNITLYAKWGIAKCTVTFADNEYASQEVIFGETIGELNEPTREGYKFGGWYSDSLYRYAFTEDTEITVNTTLYAKWIKLTDPIWFYVCGGLAFVALVGGLVYIIIRKRNKAQGYEL